VLSWERPRRREFRHREIAARFYGRHGPLIDGSYQMPGGARAQ
jgi:hypothetical protein